MESRLHADINTPERVLLGPGPSMAAPRVLRALSAPLLGHLDPEFLNILNQEQQLLRNVFQTKNELTLSISGTGSAGMEAALCNFIEPDDSVLVAVIGFFGDRMCEMARRYGAEVDRLDRPWGQIFDPAQIETALKSKHYKLLAMVHAETSTGALQTCLSEIALAAHRNGALLVLDTVTSLGGIPVEIDRWDVDIAYSATQKCLSCPSGLAPITVNATALEILRNRKNPVSNWYLDLLGLKNYWESPHTYHHTAPCSLHFALREGLLMALEEGLTARFTRHRANAELLWNGLEALDLPLLVPADFRLSTLSTPLLPSYIDETIIRKRLLEEYNIEIAGGFGPLKGKVWRIGLMGYSSRRENITLLLAALEEILRNPR